MAPEDPDETESMIPLLQEVKKAHPEANAICAGAILSTYQRTRVESVATRLGLTPLAYLWKFPVLPAPGLSDPAAGSDAQLLDDMAAAGIEARIIKVASGGLDESFLWTNVASAAGKSKLARTMRRFGTAETGAIIGEGGEFETLVVDGPPKLFKKRIVVAEEDRHVVKEDGGSAWLRLYHASLQDKGEGSTVAGAESSVRIPDLLDQKFVGVFRVLVSAVADGSPAPSLWPETEEEEDIVPRLATLQASTSQKLQPWWFVSSNGSANVEEETQSIVEQIRQRLRQQSLPPTAILSATVTLRRMADFPIINGIYNTLFDAPNPPSRVTISCGDTLSTALAGANIAIYLTVHTALSPAERQGLHVQSRSYWAPANIGPYSQAISIPVASLGSVDDSDVYSISSGSRLVSIAGQIPLVPATMALPERGDDSEEHALKLQLTLSLQHLWRIGVEMGVQWWTSAVAYFPRCASSSSAPVEGGVMAHRARLTSIAWRTAHMSSSESSPDGEEDESGPDLWDKKYNPQYTTYSSFGGEEHGKVKAGLPDRSVLAPFCSVSAIDNEAVPAVPPLFVAEVDELPRAAGVEWHAHLGVARAEEGSVTLRELYPPLLVGGEDGRAAARVSQVIVRDAKEEAGRTSFVQTIVAEPFRVGDCQRVRHGIVARDALARLGSVDLETAEPAALLRYVDVELWDDPGRGQADTGMEGPVVPCRSLWDDQGQRLAAVTVYHSVCC
jgi:diphthine-ammonia ligase